MSQENPFHPYTEETFKEIKETIDSIGGYLPDGLMSWVWNNYKLISGNVTEPQPCGCASAAGLWGKAVEVIRNFVKEREIV